MTTLLPCPFCGFVPDRDDPDCVYPASRGVYDAETDTIKHPHWNLVCHETGGGCGAHVLGDSAEDVVRRWNTRT